MEIKRKKINKKALEVLEPFVGEQVAAAMAKPLHLKMEYFFRKRYCLLLVIILFVVAVLKADSKTLNVMREAYAQGYGTIGEHMREETTRVPVTFQIMPRVPTNSGR